jgi:RNA polymerase sigma factor (sigma-70 family)
VRARQLEKHCLREHGWCPVPFEELLEAGRDGLSDSVQGYNPAIGASFVTYAWHRIQKPMRKRISEALKADKSLEAMIEAAGPEQPYLDGTEPTLGGVLEDEKTPRPDVATEWKLDHRTFEIHDLIESEAGLTRKEKKIIRQFYGLTFNSKTTPLKQIASRRRISSARASQIKEQALAKIRAAIKRRRAAFFPGEDARDPFFHPF